MTITVLHPAFVESIQAMFVAVALRIGEVQRCVLESYEAVGVPECDQVVFISERIQVGFLVETQEAG